MGPRCGGDMSNVADAAFSEGNEPVTDSGLDFDPLTDTVALPRLSDAELAEVEPFGERCRFTVNQPLFSAGDYPFNCHVIVTGRVRIVDASTGERVVLLRYGPGYFTGDIDLFTRRPSVVSCEAETDVEAIRLTPSQLRTMFTKKPQLGDTFWKSFQRRRELLLVSRFRGLSLYGSRSDKATLDVAQLLFRNSVPHEWLDTSIEQNRVALERIRPNAKSYPVVADGSRILFEAPTPAELAHYLHLRQPLPRSDYDVVVLGAGPAGLGAAVYAASEGLSCLVLDALGPGGQASSTSRIENYAGFPNGVSGHDLAHLIYLQALKFGADFHVPSTVCDLERSSDRSFEVRTIEGDCIRGKAVIVATGVSYGRLNLEGLDSLQGAGVYYSATTVESRLCQSEPVHVVGAGNSAGQAAMFLSQSDKEVSLLVRGRDLRKMSSYLSERLAANATVRIRFETEVVGIEGVESVSAVRVRGPNGDVRREPSAGLFVFIGSQPRTSFLPASVSKNERGFLLAGQDVAAFPEWKESRAPYTVETSLPGLFAAGDCRSATPKRVAFAIGDGASAVTAVHAFFGTRHVDRTMTGLPA